MVFFLKGMVNENFPFLFKLIEIDIDTKKTNKINNCLLEEWNSSENRMASRRFCTFRVDTRKLSNKLNRYFIIQWEVLLFMADEKIGKVFLNPL